MQEGTLTPDQSATITITLDVRPTFTLPDYAGLATEIKSVDATDAEVDTVIEGMRAERADFKVAERPAAKGDYVKLAYEGTVDGKPVLELAPDKQIYGKVPQTWEEVEGENEGLIPGLGKQLAGLSTGDKKDVTINFPAEFAAVPALAGKTAVYSVEVQEIRERVLPPMDEAFFKSHQSDDLASLKVNVRNNLKGRKEHENRQAQRRQVTEALNAKVDFAVPESLVESETQQVLRQFIEENMRLGVPADQFEKDKASTPRRRQQGRPQPRENPAHPRENRRAGKTHRHREGHRHLHLPRVRDEQPEAREARQRAHAGPREAPRRPAVDHFRQDP